MTTNTELRYTKQNQMTTNTELRYTKQRASLRARTTDIFLRTKLAIAGYRNGENEEN
jgi:hypothetical protein